MIIESEHRVIDQSVRSELSEIHAALLKWYKSDKVRGEILEY
jgi:hypothetical protein